MLLITWSMSSHHRRGKEIETKNPSAVYPPQHRAHATTATRHRIQCYLCISHEFRSRLFSCRKCSYMRIGDGCMLLQFGDKTKPHYTGTSFVAFLHLLFPHTFVPATNFCINGIDIDIEGMQWGHTEVVLRIGRLLRLDKRSGAHSGNFPMGKVLSEVPPHRTHNDCGLHKSFLRFCFFFRRRFSSSFHIFFLFIECSRSRRSRPRPRRSLSLLFSHISCSFYSTF